MKDQQPIGVFDSGLGGLTVLRALRKQLPAEDTVYIGDTARLPYGAKSQERITHCTMQAASALAGMGCKLIVIACNTATAAALPAVQAALPHIPIIGTIEPGARAAAQATRNGRIAVIATAATVRSGAYERGIHQLSPKASISSIACPLFVTLAEEGWMDGPIVEAIAQRYLAPAFAGPSSDTPDCLVLGCTHFPPLRSAIECCVHTGVRVVDPAEATAQEVKNTLATHRLARQVSRTDTHTASPTGTSAFYATDAPDRFAAVGSLFLGECLKTEDVQVIELG